MTPEEHFMIVSVTDLLKDLVYRQGIDVNKVSEFLAHEHRKHFTRSQFMKHIEKEGLLCSC